MRGGIRSRRRLFHENYVEASATSKTTPRCFSDWLELTRTDMYKVTSGLVDEWTRLGPAYTFNPYSEFSKFTLDMIAHCAFDLQLNSIRMPGPHRFSLAMTYFLSESGKRALRPSFISKYVLRKRNKRYWEAIEELQALSKEAIDKRKSNGKKANDVLNAMLYNEDPTNGKKMTQESCIYNTLSLLGAGEVTRPKVCGRQLMKIKDTKPPPACSAGV